MGDQFKAFADSFALPFTPVLMGRRVRPFALYHQHWLDQIESPFMQPDAPATIFDLEIASVICACGYGEIEQVANHRKNWLEKLGWQLRALTTDISKEAATFQAYIHHYIQIPKMWGSAGSVPLANSRFPDVLSIVTTLMRGNYGTKEEIWMTPVGEAHWSAASIRRDEGCEINLITPRDEAWIANFERRKQERELKRQMKGFKKRKRKSTTNAECSRARPSGQ